MQKEKRKKINNQSGAAMLIVIVFFLFISLAIIAGLVSPSIREFKDANVSLNSKESFFLSESGSEDAYYRLIKNKPIGGSETITLNSNSVTTTITSIGSNQKQISSTGSVSAYQRKTNLVLTTVPGLSFNYGIQIGTGGVYLNSGAINGNVYASGPITASSSGGNLISGTAISSGINGLISGYNQWTQFHIGTVSGTAQAHTVNNVSSTGLIYCQNGTGNNKSCTAQSDPVAANLPVADSNITGWKNDATTGGINNGDLNVGTYPTQNVTMGPKKIVGNLNVYGGGVLTVSGTLWVTGNINLTSGSQIKLISSYGANDGVIVADGNILINGGSFATGSGTAGSYIMLLTTSSSTSAVSINGGSGATIIYAPNGTVDVNGGATLKEVVGNRMTIEGGSSITYESGLINTSFSSGPSGSWSVNSWGEK